MDDGQLRLCKNPTFVFPNPLCPPLIRGELSRKPPYQGDDIGSPPDKGALGGWGFRGLGWGSRM